MGKLAEPENFDELKAELEGVQQEQLSKMGQQATKVMQEAEKAIMEAQKRVDGLAEERAKAERDRFELEMKAKEDAANVEFLQQSGSDDVTEAERKVQEANELGEPV